MKHKHLFKKTIDADFEIDVKVAMEEMFGKLPELPKGEEWGKEIQHRTIFECSCGQTQTFTDMVGGEYNKSLPDEFEVGK